MGGIILQFPGPGIGKTEVTAHVKGCLIRKYLNQRHLGLLEVKVRTQILTTIVDHNDMRLQ